MLEFGRDYEILVLNDGSTDDTAETLGRYRKVLPLTVLDEEHCKGYPHALERLLREALRRTSYPKRDAVVTLQGDFTESPDHIVPLIKTLEGGADVVTGIIEPNGHPLPRSVRIARWMAPYVLGKAHRAAPVADPLCGYRAYRLIVLKKALGDFADRPLMTSQGWAANLELLRIVAPHARRIAEAPLGLRYDIRTRPSRFDVWRTLRGLLRVRGEVWKSPEKRSAG